MCSATRGIIWLCRWTAACADWTLLRLIISWEEKLENSAFVRCNSGYLVNLAHVSGVQQNTVQVGPHELQISRPKRRAFLAALADYIGGEGA